MSLPSQSTTPLKDTDRSSSDMSRDMTSTTGVTATADRPAPVDLDSTYDTGGSSSGSTSGRSSDEAREALHKVKDFSREARQKADEQWQQARQEFERARDKLASKWQEQRGTIGEKARGLVEEQKGRACSGLNDIASAARAAADELRNRNDETIASYAEAAATQLEHLKDYFNSARIDDLGREVADFARRRPEWFLGGAFVAGLAISRFMKASDRRVGPRDHLPEGADESMFDDLVEQQHTSDYGTGYTGGSAYGGTSQPYRQGRQSGMSSTGTTAFGQDTPIGVGSQTGGTGSTTGSTPGSAIGTPGIGSGSTSTITGGLGDDALTGDDTGTRDDLLSPGSSSQNKSGGSGNAGTGTPI